LYTYITYKYNMYIYTFEYIHIYMHIDIHIYGVPLGTIENLDSDIPLNPYT
jgi:hypothetical protein